MYKWETDGILFVSDSNAKILYQYFINLYDKEKTTLFKNNNIIALFLEEHKNELKSIMNDIDIIHSLIIPSFKLISYSSLKSARK